MKVGELQSELNKFHPRAEIVLQVPYTEDEKKYVPVDITLEGAVAIDGIAHLYVREDGTIPEIHDARVHREVDRDLGNRSKVRIVKVEFNRERV